MGAVGDGMEHGMMRDMEGNASGCPVVTGGGEDRIDGLTECIDIIADHQHAVITEPERYAAAVEIITTLLADADACAELSVALAAPPPVWVPLAERWPGDGQWVWLWQEGGSKPFVGRCWDDTIMVGRTTYARNHANTRTLSWVPASVPEPPEEGEVER